MFPNLFYRAFALGALSLGGLQAIGELVTRTSTDQPFLLVSIGVVVHLLTDIKNTHEKRNRKG